MIKGIIFDYNGTLVLDDWHNQQAWLRVFVELTNDKENAEKFYKTIPPSMNKQIIQRILDAYHLTYDDEYIEKISFHKEELYHQIAIESSNYKMVKGGEDLLTYIKQLNIPTNIATASIKYNCDFYFKQLHLDRWFDKKIIVYDTGEYKNKKDMYIVAAKNMGLDIKDCMVVEDSYEPIKLAVEAGCKNIVQLNSKNKVFDLPEIIQTINDFDEFDRSIFAKK